MKCQNLLEQVLAALHRRVQDFQCIEVGKACLHHWDRSTDELATVEAVVVDSEVDLLLVSVTKNKLHNLRIVLEQFRRCRKVLLG